MTQPAQANPILLLVTVGVVTGTLLSVLSANIDLQCVPDFEPRTSKGKLTGLVNMFKFAAAHPLTFFPIFFGFSALGVAVVAFPFLFKLPSRGRSTALFGIVGLLLGGVGYGIYLLPRGTCDGSWLGLSMLLQITVAVFMWFIVLLLVFRSDRNSAS